MRPISPVIAVAAVVLIAFGVAFAQETTPASERLVGTAPAQPSGQNASLTGAMRDTAPPAPATLSLLSPPPRGKAQIVFFRPNRFSGAAFSFTVRENDVSLGRLTNGRYFIHVVEPGVHEYDVGGDGVLRMEVEPGQTYYVQQNAEGLISDRAVLALTDEAAFEAAVGRMRPADPINQRN